MDAGRQQRRTSRLDNDVESIYDVSGAVQRTQSGHSARFDAVDARVDRVDSKVDGLGTKFAREFAEVDTAFAQIDRNWASSWNGSMNAPETTP